MGKKRRPKTRRRKTTVSEQQTTELLSSADIIGGNEDLLRNVLINIPEKPLSRFKSVSKTWLSVISDPHFSLRWHTKHIPSPSALFCYAYNQYSFVPLDNREKNNSFDCIFNVDPFPVAMHPYDRPLIYQSCNGLLLLTIRGDNDYNLPYPFPLYYGVFFDGAIHWPTWIHSISVCFDIDEECCFQFPMPPIQGGKKRRSIRYFGESGGYLHLIDCKDSDLRFNVFEMEYDYSKWFVKYKVDLVDALGWRFIAFGWDIKRFNVVILVRK
ncbi:hypothetical protein LguiB_009751 [Lonicera macranthoides]